MQNDAHPNTPVMNNGAPPKTEVIYQIYPTTFYDSNGDGHGDLKGITAKLDYLKDLHIDALWISPFFISPEGTAGDGGYAIDDYRKAGPKFNSLPPDTGTDQEKSDSAMEDFRELVSQAHTRGLRIYTDFVVCHTSNRHQWFEKSRNPNTSENPDYDKYKDFYVWHPGIDPATAEFDKHRNLYSWNEDMRAPNGRIPPNNWRSVFANKDRPDEGRPAWTFDPVRKEFFLHHFNDSQPALNHNNPEVRKAIIREMEYWLEAGVDGIRIDALPFANYDPEFKSNPRREDAADWPGDWRVWWNRQEFAHSMTQDSTYRELVPEIRAALDKYGARSVGEGVAGKFGGNGDVEYAAKCLDSEEANKARDGRAGLHTCYTNAWVSAFFGEGGAQYPTSTKVRGVINRLLENSPEGNFCNNFSNHDFPRFASQIESNTDPVWRPTVKKQLMLLLMSLPGSLCLYNGDELGLHNARHGDIPKDKIQDPAVEKREYYRTPLPWRADELNAGFSTHADPILPVPDSHRALAVDIQEMQAGSMLKITRRGLKQRRQNPALHSGNITLLDTYDPIVAFVRETEEQAVLCAFNMSNTQHYFIPSKCPQLKDHPELLNKMGIAEGQAITIAPYDSTFHGLVIDNAQDMDDVEIGMKPSAATTVTPPQAENANGHIKHKPLTIFAADLLLADDHMAGREVESVLDGLIRSPENQQHSENQRIIRGEKSTISKEEYQALMSATGDHEGVTAGGSTSCTLRTLKELLKKDVNINLLGFAADDDAGRTIREFLEKSDIHIVPGTWPDGVPQDTAVSLLIRHDDGKHTILTYPGTEIQAFQKSMEKKLPAAMVEENVRQTDVVYLSESVLDKFGRPFLENMLKMRWEQKKDLVLVLPTHATFGPTDSELFREWIPSCNVVMGNDVEFCRILLNKDKTRDEITSNDIDAIAKELQAGFQREVLKNEWKLPEQRDQVAFITRGAGDALLVTKDGVIPVHVPNIPQEQIKNRLGAGNAAFAGFMAGYVKGQDYLQSATFAMGLAGEKVKQDSLAPYIEHVKQAVAHASKHCDWGFAETLRRSCGAISEVT